LQHLKKWYAGLHTFSKFPKVVEGPGGLSGQRRVEERRTRGSKGKWEEENGPGISLQSMEAINTSLKEAIRKRRKMKSDMDYQKVSGLAELYVASTADSLFFVKENA